MEKTTLESILGFAIEKEHEAREFYEKCSESTSRDAMKKAFLEMADEERKHAQMLEKFKPGTVQKLQIKPVEDMRISDYLVDMEFKPDMKYSDLLVLAMKREEKAHALYKELENRSENPEAVKLFQFLAAEEMKHKHKLEKEYDEGVLLWN